MAAAALVRSDGRLLLRAEAAWASRWQVSGNSQAARSRPVNTPEGSACARTAGRARPRRGRKRTSEAFSFASHTYEKFPPPDAGLPDPAWEGESQAKEGQQLAWVTAATKIRRLSTPPADAAHLSSSSSTGRRRDAHESPQETPEAGPQTDPARPRSNTPSSAASSASPIVGGATVARPVGDNSRSRDVNTEGLGLVRALSPCLTPVFSPAVCPSRPSASARRTVALPGRFAFGWSGAGAHPDSVTNSNVARTFPSGSAEALRVDLHRAHQDAARQRGASAINE